MLCLIMTNAEIANKLVLKAKSQGLIYFGFSSKKSSKNYLTPSISKKEIEDGCNIILNILDSIQ